MNKVNTFFCILMMLFPFSTAWAQGKIGEEIQQAKNQRLQVSETNWAQIDQSHSEKLESGVSVAKEHATQNGIDIAHQGCGNHNIPKEYQHDYSESDIRDYLNFVRNNESIYTSENLNCIEIPVNIVVTSKSDGTGSDSDTRLRMVMETVNQFCRSSNLSIRFKITRLHRINDDNYYNIPNQWDKFLQLRNQYTDYPSAVPLIIVGDCGAGGYGGVEWLAVTNKYYGPNVWLHEMGHFLGLAHTHDQGNELVNGSNCSTAGDLVCDTPAEPAESLGGWVVNCQYTGQHTDANNQRYNPDPRNVMAYSDGRCQDKLTNGQQARVLYFLQTKYPQIVPSSNCDGGGGGHCQISFTNTGCQTAELFWSDNDPRSFGTIAPGQTKIVNSHGGATWVMKVGSTEVGNYYTNCGSTNYSFNSGGCGVPTIAAFGETKCYRFNNRHSGKVMEVGGNSTENGGIVQQWGWLGSKSQVWRVKDVGSGFYQIVNGNSGRVLNVADASTGNGSPINQWEWLGGNNQKWKLAPNAEGYYTITAQHSGKTLDVYAWETNDGAKILHWDVNNQANQQWEIAEATCPAGTVSGPVVTPIAAFSDTKCYRFNNQHSGKVMEVGGNSTENGGIVQQWGWLGSKSQVWRVKDVGSGFYQIVNGNSGRVLNVADASTGNGAPINQWEWLGGNHQKWKLAPNAEGYYTITAQHSGKTLDVYAAETNDGAKILHWDVNNQANQKWQIAETTCPAGTATDPCATSSVVSTVAGNLAICAGQTTVLTASGGTTYRWSNGATTPSITVGIGTYSVTATNAGGCTGVKTVTVTQAGSITASISGSTTVCSGQTTTLTASGGNSYQWSNGATNASITVGVGTYTVTATNAGSCSGVKTITVSQSGNSTVNVSGTTTVCSGQTTTLTASGGTSYLWSNGSTNASIPVAAGTYTVTATNAGGCTGTKTVTVTQSDVTANVSGSTTVCSGQTTTLTASGGATYLWSNGSTNASIPVAAGTYTVTATNAGGCTGTKTVTVTQSDVMVSVNGNTTICTGQTTTLTASGGTSYKWSNGLTSSSIIVGTISMGPGNYTVTATNAGGCTGTRTVTVTQSGNITASISGSTNVCSGQTTTLTASGGTTYLWSNGSTNASITVGAGNYTVTATNAGGCTGVKTATVTLTNNNLAFTNCPGNINLSTSNGCAAANWTTPVATSACGTPVVSSNYSPGFCFPVGTTTVTYTAALAGATPTTCSFTVTVAQTGSNCDNIAITPGSGQITASGLTSPIVMVQVFNSAWQQVYNFANAPTSSSQTVPNLPSGTYFVKVTLLTSAWTTICKKEDFFTVSSGGNNLCPDGTPKKAPGTACDDGNPNTANDVVQADGCACAGTPTGSDCDAVTIVPGNGQITVSGLTSPIVMVQVFNATWQQVYSFANAPTGSSQTVPNLPSGTYFVKVTLLSSGWGTICKKEDFFTVSSGGNNLCPDGTPKKTPGTSCNDGNPATSNDVIQADGCACAGTPNSGGTDCSAITVTAGAGSIQIGNVGTAPIIWAQIFDANWQSVFSGAISSVGKTVSGLLAGQYFVKVEYIAAGWSSVMCKKEQFVTINSNLLANSAALTFNAYKKDTESELKWLSNTGERNDFFVVERSANGLTDFAPIAKVDGIGAQNEVLYFSETDGQPLKGDNYYRLKLVFQDGSFIYSQVEKLNFPSFEGIVVYPNPATDRLFIALGDLAEKDIQIRLINQYGQLVREMQTTDATETIEMSLDGVNNGFYLLQISAAGQRPVVQKAVVETLK